MRALLCGIGERGLQGAVRRGAVTCTCVGDGDAGPAVAADPPGPALPALHAASERARKVRLLRQRSVLQRRGATCCNAAAAGNGAPQSAPLERLRTARPCARVVPVGETCAL
jgi:hypothetical protein